MGIFNILDPVLDFILGSLLNFGYLIFLLIMSFLISLGIMLLTKYATNQKLMKELKDSMKSYQDQIKQHKSNPSKALELQKKAMELNLEYMRHGLKTTLYSFIPIIIMLGWIGSNVGYMPIKSGEQFNVTIQFNKNFNGNAAIDVPAGIELQSGDNVTVNNGRASWSLKSEKEGDYELIFNIDHETLSKNVLITNELKHSPVVKRKKGLMDFIYGSREGYLDSNSSAEQIILGNNPTKPLNKLGIFGWHPGWLGVYIISSIVFTMILRKVLKVY